MLGATVFLLWLSFQNIQVESDESKWGFMLKIWSTANKPFLFLSASAAILSHVLRAERWKLLLNPLKHDSTLKQSFLSVMVGYFINLAIPRGGEVSRCYNLYRLNGTPVDVSLGTVVAERVIDLIFLLVLITISFFIELDNLLLFFQSDEVSSLAAGKGSSFPWMIAFGMVLLLASVYVIFRLFFKYRRILTLRLISRTKTVLIGIRRGLYSVFKLERKWLFIFYSFLIWFLYYMMMYLVMLAFPETSGLGFLAALTIFVIGGLAMAIPLPGGAGSFHVLVPLGLVMLYGLAQDKAVAFTFIFHGWQTLVIIIVGALSLILTQHIKHQKIDSQ